MTTAGALSPADVAVGASVRAVGLLRRTARTVGSAMDPVAHVALRPPLVPDRWQPAALLGSLGREGAAHRVRLRDEALRRLDKLLPAVLAEILRRISLTELLLEYVDLDTVVAAVDLDLAAERLDLEPVVARVDVEAVVDRVDVDAVARRLDLDAVLDRLDLTAVVLQRVDLDRVVEAILSRVDLVGLAEEVIDGVNLPEIIRESTGSMASDTVHGVRMQGIAADEAVGRAVDRILLRRGRRPGGTPGPAAPAQSHGTP
ncbi:MAG TPA: hypothetical protein VFZ64_04555 [Nocardioidaceae bacterium]